MTSRDETLERRLKVHSLHVMGLNQVEIARLVGIPQQRVSDDLNWCRENLKPLDLRAMHTALPEEVRQLCKFAWMDYLKREPGKRSLRDIFEATKLKMELLDRMGVEIEGSEPSDGLKAQAELIGLLPADLRTQVIEYFRKRTEHQKASAAD